MNYPPSHATNLRTPSQHRVPRSVSRRLSFALLSLGLITLGGSGFGQALVNKGQFGRVYTRDFISCAVVPGAGQQSVVAGLIKGGAYSKAVIIFDTVGTGLPKSFHGMSLTFALNGVCKMGSDPLPDAQVILFVTSKPDVTIADWKPKPLAVFDTFNGAKLDATTKNGRIFTIGGSSKDNEGRTLDEVIAPLFEKLKTDAYLGLLVQFPQDPKLETDGSNYYNIFAFESNAEKFRPFITFPK